MSRCKYALPMNNPGYSSLGFRYMCFGCYECIKSRNKEPEHTPGEEWKCVRHAIAQEKEKRYGTNKQV